MQYTGNADISRYVVDCLYGRDNKYSDWDIYVYTVKTKRSLDTFRV